MVGCLYAGVLCLKLDLKMSSTDAFFELNFVLSYVLMSTNSICRLLLVRFMEEACIFHMQMNSVWSFDLFGWLP